MRLLRRLLPDLIAILILFALPLGFFNQQTLGGKTLLPTENIYQYEPYASERAQASAPEYPHNHLISDLVLENYQWKNFIITQLGQGEIPLWNPHQFAGIPFLAAGQHSALYPLSAIYYMMDLPSAYGWFTVVNLWLAGVFMYAFIVLGLGLRREAAMMAGVIYQFNGFVIASVVFQMMIGGIPWLPLMLLMTEFIIRQQRLMGRAASVPWVFVGAGALGMNILAGHVEITIYTLLITGFYAAVRLLVVGWRRRTWSLMVKQGAWLLLMIGLGFTLGAIQFLPLFEFANSNWRAARTDFWQVLDFAHKPRDILQFLLPNFYGNPSHHQYFDVFSMQMVPVTGVDQTHTDWGIKNYVEGALYVGVLPLLLSVYALYDRWIGWRFRNEDSRATTTAALMMANEPPYRAIFAILGFFSLLFMFGVPVYAIVYVLPGINQLNSAFRWVFALTLSVSVLSAFGMDALIRRAAEKLAPRLLKVGLLVMIAGLMLMVALLASRLLFPQLEPIIEQVRGSMLKASNAFPDARSFYSYEFGNLAILSVMLFLSGGMIWRVGWMRGFAGFRRWAILSVALVTVDLMIASWGFNPASDPSLLTYKPASIAFLQSQQQEGEIWRFTTYEDNRGPILNANLGWMHGLYDIRGYDSIIPGPTMALMESIAPQVQRDFNRIAPIFTTYEDEQGNAYSDSADALASPVLDQLAVRYVLTYADQNIDVPGYELAYSDNSVRIYENTDALPYAYLQPLDDEQPIPLTVYNNTGREKFIDLTVNQPRTLIISENYADGWRAFIRPIGAAEDTEQPLEVVATAHNLQSIELPISSVDLSAGGYTLRLVYSPVSFQVGLFGSVLGVLVLTLLAGIWVWRSFVGTNTEESSTTARVARNSIAPIVLRLFNRGIDFVLAFIIYRMLDQQSVGTYNFAVVIFVWFDIFINFGLNLYLIREVARDKLRSGFFFFNTSLMRFGLFLIGIVLLIAFLDVWPRLGANAIEQEGIGALFLLYLGLLPATLNTGMTALFYAYERAEVPSTIETITAINKAVFGVIVLVLGGGIIGLAAVSIVNNFITFGILVWQGRGLIGRIPSFRPDFRLMANMARESWPLMLNHFLATIFFQFDIVILQAVRGEETVAQYSTSYKWLLAINIVPAMFTQALFPVLSRQSEEDMDAFYRSYTFGLKLMLTLSLPLAVAFMALAEVLTVILAGPSYLPNAAIALQVMIWSIPLGWLNSLTQYALIALNLQRWITVAFFLAVGFNIVTNLIFIPQYGFVAAAVTTIFSEAALLIPFGILMQRGMNRPVPWWGITWRPVLAALAMLAVTLITWPLLNVIAVVLGALVYAIVLIALRPLSDEESAMLSRMLPNRLAQSRIGRFVLNT
ncbi:MAG: oligosaccharide flippase family protein [Anaerolineaceae bacterium]|nr:oligosaccharide flippase family protein [Anaerolineaceae bacterium]